MTKSNSGKKKYINYVCELGLTRSGDDMGGNLTQELKNKFIDFVSDTEDNRQLINRFEYGVSGGTIGEPNEEQGVIFSSYGELVTDILFSAIGAKVPFQVLEEYPDLDQEEWSDILRFSALTLSALNWSIEDNSSYIEGYHEFSREFDELFDDVLDKLELNSESQEYFKAIDGLQGFMVNHFDKRSYFYRHFIYEARDRRERVVRIIADLNKGLGWKRLVELLDEI